jgi:hypothetical protein
LREIREDSLLLSKNNENPEFNHEANKEIDRLKEVISQLEKERETWKLKAEFLSL